MWVKIKCQGTAGFSPCFHLPGLHSGYLFLTHTYIYIYMYTRSSTRKLNQPEVPAKDQDTLLLPIWSKRISQPQSYLRNSLGMKSEKQDDFLEGKRDQQQADSIFRGVSWKILRDTTSFRAKRPPGPPGYGRRNHRDGHGGASGR